MRIHSVRIQNFRCFKDQTIVFDNYTCFVGANGAGKSTVFNALNIFFRQYKDSKTDLSKLCKDDYHHKNTEEDIRITVTFADLSPKAQEDLAAYHRQDQLIITAVATYDSQNEKAEVKQYGSRLGMQIFRRFFDVDKQGGSVAELKAVYSELRKQFSELPAPGTKAAMTEALQTYESERPEECTLIESEDQFYGATKGQNRLSPHIQWVFVPALKDVTEECEESKTSALGIILSRTVRSKVNFSEKVSQMLAETKRVYSTILAENQEVLNELSISLEERLASWAHPNISAEVLWSENGDKSIRIEEPTALIKVGERGFEGSLSRFGHGMQRSYLFALLQELTITQNETGPTLIMCIEEPELYQHPPQARYLAETLLDLSQKGTQILLCTHCPFFIPGDGFQHIRIARENGNPSHTTIMNLSYEVLAAKLEEIGEKPLREEGLVAKLYPSISPITSEMFFCKILILVEGYEDVAYLKAYLHLTGKLKDFRRYGCHIVPVMGKSEIIKPLAVAGLLGIPTYVVCDGDTNKIKEGEVVKHKKDNRSILNLQGHEGIFEWPELTFSDENITMWKANLGDEIVGDFDNEIYTQAKDHASAFYGMAPGLEKNPLAIVKILEYCWNKGQQSVKLIALIESIIAFAQSHTVVMIRQPKSAECVVEEATILQEAV